MPSVMGKTSLSAKLSMMLTMPKLYLLCLLGLRPLQMKRALDIPGRLIQLLLFTNCYCLCAQVALCVLLFTSFAELSQ